MPGDRERQSEDSRDAVVRVRLLGSVAVETSGRGPVAVPGQLGKLLGYLALGGRASPRCRRPAQRGDDPSWQGRRLILRDAELLAADGCPLGTWRRSRTGSAEAAHD